MGCTGEVRGPHGLYLYDLLLHYRPTPGRTGRWCSSSSRRAMLDLRQLVQIWFQDTRPGRASGSRPRSPRL